QRPVPLAGNLIKYAWIQWYDEPPEHRRGTEVVQSWDVASTTSEASDFSVCTTWLIEKRNYFLLDLWRGRVEFPTIKRQLIHLAKMHQPSRILVEQAGPGLHLIQEFRANPLPGIPIPIGIRPEGDKR